MTTEDMLKKLDGIAVSRDAAKAQALNDKRTKMEQALKEVEKLLPKVFELGPVVKRLVELGVGVDKKDTIFAHNRFLTNSWSHNLGFCGRTDRFGYYAGGACGNLDLVAHRITGKGKTSIRWSAWAEAKSDELMTAKQFAKKYFDNGYFINAHACRMAEDIRSYVNDVESTVSSLNS